ncbi:MAG: WecB/TagA/CpsF family glycosyltransferase [Spirochaetales bacterium]|nr:WecB/TagA/CpsF family glycosyltransferase [Spirochaetales bacterium]
MDKVDICRVEIDNLRTDEALERIDSFIESGKSHYIVTPNVDHIIKLQNDRDFQEIYRNASLVLADGQPLIWASRFLGTPIVEKISGSDLLPALCRHAASKGYSVFFLGGRPGAADKAAEKLSQSIKDLKIAGTYCPDFGFEKDPEENCKIVSLLRDSNADILFVGLGAPKQEKWIYNFHNDYGIPLSAGIGVSFEFIAGMVKRAPLWMQRSGLEWFWRVMMEPGRLWKRYFIDDMKIFKLVFNQKFKKTALKEGI